MAKLLFIHPNTDSIGRQSIPTTYVSAILKENGHNVELFDTTFFDTRELVQKDSSHEDINVDLGFFKKFELKNESLDFEKKKINITDIFLKKVEEFKPDFIAFSQWGSQLHGEGEFHAFFHGIEILKKSNLKNIPIFVGGTAPNFDIESTLRNYQVDYLIKGEAEYVFLDIANHIDQKKPLDDILNLAFIKNNNLISNKKRPLIEPLDQLPLADYSIYDERTLYRPYHGKIYRCIDFELSRGCLYNCTFCISPFQRKTYDNPKNFRREKSIDRIIEEVSFLKEKLNLDIIRYQDETFLSMKEEKLIELSKVYKEKVNLPFIIESTINTVSEAKIKALKEMGCLSISFGLESGSEHLRKKVIKKPNFTNKQAIENLKMVKRYGISFNVFNIVGFPEETEEMIFETINVNHSIKPPYCQVGYFQPWEGVSLRDYSIENNYLDKDSTGLDNSKDNLLDSPLKNLPIQQSRLKHLREKFQLYVYFNKFFWPLINFTYKKNFLSNFLFKSLKFFLKLRFKFIS